MKFVVTGATGFIGRALCLELSGKGFEVVALSRDAQRARKVLGETARSLTWGADGGQEWREALEGADAIIHLAGESVAAQRWTPEFKRRIIASRTETTRLLVDAISKTAVRPKALISASAVGYYGDRGEEVLTEESAAGADFLAEVCQKWEAEAMRVTEMGVREARMRIGIVLGDGGSLERILQPIPLPISPWRLGLRGTLGNGKQWMPWVHIEDAVGLFLFAATHAEARGAVNVTAPNPVTNRDFTRALGRVLRRPAPFPVPAFALRLALGEFAQVILGGQRALPAQAQAMGYAFRFSDVETALQSLLGR